MKLEKIISNLVKEGELVRLPSGLLALPWVRDPSWVEENSFLGTRRPLRLEELKTEELLMLLDPCFAVDGEALVHYRKSRKVEKDFPTELCFYGKEAPSWYSIRINHLVRNSPAPILLGFPTPERELHKYDLQLELNWFKRLNPKGPRVIYFRDSFAIPEIPTGWDSLIAGIKETFDPEKITFGGGTFWVDYDNKIKDAYTITIDTKKGNPLRLCGQGALCSPIRELQPHFQCSLDPKYCYES